MRIIGKNITVPINNQNIGLLNYFEQKIMKLTDIDSVPIRFAVTDNNKEFHIELDTVTLSKEHNDIYRSESIFNFNKRNYENTNQFNAVLIIPTGIGAELGGHSGDGGPLARVLSSFCDNLITHPNVVNASDINELPENGLYVEGSVLTRLLMGTVALQKVRSNRILIVIDEHDDPQISEHSINAASAARASLGIDCPLIYKMQDKIGMRSEFSESGRAVGKIDHLERLFEVLEENKGNYDAVAISSVINVPASYHQDYYLTDMVNPWGGVEAMLTHAVSSAFNIPSAHSPMMESNEVLNLNVGVVDPRMSAEVVSVAYLHCVLKGLQRSPKIITDESLFNNSDLISAKDVSCIVIPDGCIGLPTLAALEQGIPVIAVKENKNKMRNDLTKLPFGKGKLFIVDTYLEAIGVMAALKAGVALETVQRPLEQTNIWPELREEIAAELGNVIRFRSK